MDKKARVCKNCGHDIDYHRLLKSGVPDACLFVIIDKDGREQYCPCSKFVKEKEEAKR